MTMSCLSESFVCAVSRALSSDHVPCVLWGHWLLNVHGIPSIINSIDFVIPDGCLATATQTLTRFKTFAQFEGLMACADPDSCGECSPRRPTPPPAFHIHTQKDPEVTVGLYLQSQTLWFLPPLSMKNTYALPSYFVLASDQTVLPPWRPGRGSGVFKPDSEPVLVPKSHILLEAFLRLYARNAWKLKGSFGMAMIAYMELYVDDDGLLDVNLLPEPLRTFYIDLREGAKPVRQWTKELRDALGIVGYDEDDHDY